MMRRISFQARNDPGGGSRRGPRRGPRRAPCGTAGLTLFELLVVLTIVALIAAVIPAAAPGGGAGPSRDDYARRVAGELRAARAQAIAEGRTVWVRHDARRGRLGRGDGAPTPAALSVALTPPAGLVDARPSPGVAFFADGGATGGAITIADAAGATRVSVRWLTGAVRLAEVEP